MNIVHCKNRILIYYKKFNKNIIRYKQNLKGQINNGLNGTKTKLLDSENCAQGIKAMTDE